MSILTQKKKKLNKKTKTISIHKNKQNKTKTKKNFGVKTMKGGAMKSLGRVGSVKSLGRGSMGSMGRKSTIKRSPFYGMKLPTSVYGMSLGKPKSYTKNVGVINPTQHIYANLDANKPENPYANLDAIKSENRRSTAIENLEKRLNTQRISLASPPPIKLLNLLKAVAAEKNRKNTAYEDSAQFKK